MLGHEETNKPNDLFLDNRDHSGKKKLKYIYLANKLQTCL